MGVGSLNFEYEEVEKLRNVFVLRFLDIHAVALFFNFSVLFLAGHVFLSDFLFLYIYPGAIFSCLQIILDSGFTLKLLGN